MSFEPLDEPGRKSPRLAGTLKMVGFGKIVLAVLVLILAFTGYDTPRAVNVSLLLIGVNLAVLGGMCLSAGKSFESAANDPASLVGPALEKTNRLFGYYLFLLGLAVLGVGVDTAGFLVRIASR